MKILWLYLLILSKNCFSLTVFGQGTGFGPSVETYKKNSNETTINVTESQMSSIENPTSIDNDSVIEALQPSVPTNGIDDSNSLLSQENYQNVTNSSQDSVIVNDTSVDSSDIASDSNVKSAVPQTIVEDSSSQNESSTTNGNTSQTPPILTEEIPTFSEWTQRQIEAELTTIKNTSKSSQIQNGGSLESTQENGSFGVNNNANDSTTMVADGSTNNLTGTKPNNSIKLQWKNYASLDCGAKVVSSNPEAISASAILTPSRDEYKLNPCTSRIWFVVELCEAIQAKRIDFANFELFSSSPENFTVSIANRFPTREWSQVGQFTALDERDIQSFDLDPHLFGKFIKVDVKSHYGSEHYCPITLFRVYGTSEFEVLQKEDAMLVSQNQEDDDDEDGDGFHLNTDSASKNLLSSATDAVISIVKKAAEVLGSNTNFSNQSDVLKNDSSSLVIQLAANDSEQLEKSVNNCVTLRHNVICGDMCSKEANCNQIYQLMSCQYNWLKRWLDVKSIRTVFLKTFHQNGNSIETDLSRFWRALLPITVQGAICNLVAVESHTATLNSTRLPMKTTNHSEEVVRNQNAPTEDSMPTVTTDLDTENSSLSSTTLPPPVLLVPPQIVIQNGGVSDAHLASTCSTGMLTTSDGLNDGIPTIIPTRTILINTTNFTVDEAASNETIFQQNGGDNGQREEFIDVVPQEASEEGEYLVDLSENVQHSGNTNGAAGEPTTSSPPLPTVPINVPQGHNNKESVFLRLSNRIKILERNMSLSSQYMEELSRRYKRQVEEYRHLETNFHRLSENHRRLDDLIRVLEERLTSLADQVTTIIEDNHHWSLSLSVIITTIFACALFLLYFKGRASSEAASISASRGALQRRSSEPTISQLGPAKPLKRRRPSEYTCQFMFAPGLKYRRISNKRLWRQRRQTPLPSQLRRIYSSNSLMQTFNLREFDEKKPDDDSSRIENLNHDASTKSRESIEIPIKTGLSLKSAPNRIFQINTVDDDNQRLIITNGHQSCSTECTNTPESTPKKERKVFGRLKMFKKVF